MSRVLKMFGPPGTGKTTELLNLLEKVLESGIPPERVAYLTFTVKARREALSRAVNRFGFDPKTQMPFFKTLHSIAYHQLAIGGSTMIKGRELTEFSELVGLDLSGMSYQTESGLAITNGSKHGDLFMTFDHLRRHREMSTDEAHKDWREDFTLAETKYFVETYEQWKSTEGLLDFTDLLMQVSEPLPVDVVFVDEAQDLSLLQWRALTILSKKAKKIYIAGDDDQAIFRWAGADPDVLIDIKGETKVLGQSYRVPQSVHEIAGRMIQGVKKRQPKEWEPRKEKGRVQWMAEPEHVDWERDGSYLVLYRNHYLRDRMEGPIHTLGIPYGHTARPTVGAEWGEAIFSWERLRKGETVPVQMIEPILDAMVPGRQMGRDSRSRLDRDGRAALTLGQVCTEIGVSTRAPWYEALGRIPSEEISYLRKVVKNHGAAALTDAPKIHMTTIHAVKGGQAEHVVLMTDCSRRVHNEIILNPDDERRVFYVALTRAITSLQIVDSFNNSLFNSL